MDYYTTQTIYDGSGLCRKCGEVISPVEMVYGDKKMCPACRNGLYAKHAKGMMSNAER